MFRTQPSPRLIPGREKRFPFPSGWVHLFEGLHPGEGLEMTVDLKWRDAMAVAGWAFGDDARSAGWQQSMSPRQLAAIQRPFDHADAAGKARCAALFKAVSFACEAGHLVCTEREFRTIRTVKNAVPPYSGQFLGQFLSLPGRVVSKQEAVTKKLNFVRAQDFADWLREQPEEPSQYVAHWFKLQGVVERCPVLEPVPKTSAMPTTWKGLVAYHKANAGHLFTPALKNIVAIERIRRAEQPGAAAAMAAELGISTARLNELVRTKDEHGKRSAAQVLRTGTK